MKIRNRVCSLLIALSMFAACAVLLPTPAQAATENTGLTVSVEKVTSSATYGGPVKVTVTIPKNNGFLGLNFDVVWDTAVLDLVEVKTASDFNLVEANYQEAFNRVVVTVGDPLLGVMRPAETEKVTATGTVIELTMKIKVDADAQPEIKLERASYVLTDGEVSDAITLNGTTVDVIASNKEPVGGTDKTCPTENGQTIHMPGPAATCVAPQRCTVCGTVLAEMLEHDLKTVPAQEVTCGENGWEAYEKCKFCNYTTYVEISATGEHSFGEWVVIKEATENHAGEKIRTCSVCDLDEVEEITFQDGSDQTDPDEETPEQSLPVQVPTQQNPTKQKMPEFTWLIVAAVLVLVCAAVLFVVLKKKSEEKDA